MTVSSGEILARLRSTRFAAADGWVAMEEVTPPKVQRRFDLIAVHAWQSGRKEVHGVEIKVSRGDWLREAADPGKSKPLMALCDRYWLCCPPEICSKGEVPSSWGLLHVSEDQIRQTKPAPDLEPAPWGADIWRCMLLRCQTRTNTEAEIHLAEQRGRKEAEERLAEQQEHMRSSMVQDLEQLRERIKVFEEATGIELNRWSTDREIANVGRIARHIAAIHRDLRPFEIQLLTKQAQILADHLTRAAQLAEDFKAVGGT